MLLAAGLAAVALPSLAQDRLRVSATRRGTWDGAVVELAQRLGIMKRHGIELEINYVWGSRDAVNAIVTNAADVGIAADVVDVLDAALSSAPVQIIAGQATGAHDLYWYVRASSPIRAWTDTDRRTIAYSTDCCTRSVVKAFIREKSLKARPVATGWPSPTLSQVLSGQIDIGWAAPPFGLEHLENSEIRIFAQGSDSSFADITLRVNITSQQMNATRRDPLTRFMRGWRQTIDAMYADPRALKLYADWRRMPLERARRLRDQFFPKPMLDPDRMIGLERTMAEAVADGTLRKPLPSSSLSDLVQRIPN